MKKTKYLLLVISLSLVFQANAQMQDINDAVQIKTNFDQNRGVLTFSAENEDYCDYYIFVDLSYLQGFLTIGTGRTVTIRHGQQQLFTLKVNPDASSYSYGYKYAMFRGNVDAKKNIDFAYSLPCAREKTVKTNIKENAEGYQLAFDLPSDTVYACRGGVVCNDNLKDYTAKGHKNFNDSRYLSQITVYHEDGTFGEYVFVGKSLVIASETIKMGKPIAVLSNNQNNFPINFSVYFLDKNKVKEKNIGNKHTHFRPFFQTVDGGKMRLEAGETYLCEQNDEMLMQDMSKREKKKFLKNKTKNEE
jgi:hypothetical protein